MGFLNLVNLSKSCWFPGPPNFLSFLSLVVLQLPSLQGEMFQPWGKNYTASSHPGVGIRKEKKSFLGWESRQTWVRCCRWTVLYKQKFRSPKYHNTSGVWSIRSASVIQCEAVSGRLPCWTGKRCLHYEDLLEGHEGFCASEEEPLEFPELGQCGQSDLFPWGFYDDPSMKGIPQPSWGFYDDSSVKVIWWPFMRVLWWHFHVVFPL